MHHCPCELHVSFIRLDVIIESGHVIHAQVATEIDAYDGPYRKDYVDRYSFHAIL